MKFFAALCLVALTACGAKGPLKWPEEKPPPTPVGATVSPTTDELLEQPAQAQPERVDDPVRRSKERGEDEFDLPPPGA